MGFTMGLLATAFAINALFCGLASFHEFTALTLAFGALALLFGGGVAREMGR